MVDNTKCKKILVRKPDRKKPLGRLMCRQEDNCITDLTEIVWEGVG
jgi:hypothetical protein